MKTRSIKNISKWTHDELVAKVSYLSDQLDEMEIRMLALENKFPDVEPCDISDILQKHHVCQHTECPLTYCRYTGEIKK